VPATSPRTTARRPRAIDTAHTRSVAVRLDDAWRADVDPALLEDWRPEPFALEGGETRVVEMGAGPPLVLVAPLPGYKESWVAVASRLARTHRVITFDLRARFDGPPSWEALVADLDRIVTARAAEAPVVLVGHSLGGALAQRYALARPGRVKALVLSSSFARMRTPHGDVWARFIEQPVVIAAQRWLPERMAIAWARRLCARGGWVYDGRCEDWVLRFVRHGIRSEPIATGFVGVRLAFDHDLRGRLAGLGVPVLLVRGERESPFVREATQELSQEIPGAALAVSPGVGHLHPLSAAAWFADTVGGWLATT